MTTILRRVLLVLSAVAMSFPFLVPSPAGALTGHATKTNVGVLPGVTLTEYTGPNPITSCGTTLTNKYLINTDLDIRVGNGHDDEAHPCVTLNNVLVYGGVIDVGYTAQGFGPLVANDTSVVNRTTRDVACVSLSHFYLHRVMTTGCRSGAQSDGFTGIYDSYLEATREYCAALHGGSGPCQHLDGFLSNGNYGNPITLQNDTLYCNPTEGDPVEVGAGCAADLGLFADNGPPELGNIFVFSNLFKATNAAFYCISGPNNAMKRQGVHDVYIVGNDFETNTGSNCGHLGNIDNGWVNDAATNRLQCQNYFVGTTTNAMPAAPNC